MTGPSVVVVFADSEGDEFPVCVGVPSWAADEAQTIAAARRAKDRAVAEGGWRPTGGVQVRRIER